MRSEVERYLDGEIPRDALPPELVADADEWDRLIDSAGAGDVRAPAWVEQRVMSAVEAGSPAPGWRRAWAALVEPRTVRVRPISVALAASAAAVLLTILPVSPPAPTLDGPPVVGTAAEREAQAARVYIQFEYSAPDARSVAVAGDFTGWSAEEYTLRDPDGDGLWTGLVPLSPGVHKYMFVVDGDEWVTDPRAQRYVDDGFGMRNAVLAVAPPDSRAS